MKAIHLMVFGLPGTTDQPTSYALSHLLRAQTAEVVSTPPEMIHVHLAAGLLDEKPTYLRLVVEMPGCPAESMPVIMAMYAEALADFAARRLTDCESVEVTMHADASEPQIIRVPDIRRPQWPIRLWEPDRLNHPLAHRVLDRSLVSVCAFDMRGADMATLMRVVNLVVLAAERVKTGDFPTCLPAYFDRVRLEPAGSRNVIWAYDFVTIMSDDLARAGLHGWKPRIFSEDNEAWALRLCQVLLARFGHQIHELPRVPGL